MASLRDKILRKPEAEQEVFTEIPDKNASTHGRGSSGTHRWEGYAGGSTGLHHNGLTEMHDALLGEMKDALDMFFGDGNRTLGGFPSQDAHPIEDRGDRQGPPRGFFGGPLGSFLFPGFSSDGQNGDVMFSPGFGASGGSRSTVVQSSTYIDENGERVTTTTRTETIDGETNTTTETTRGGGRQNTALIEGGWDTSSGDNASPPSPAGTVLVRPSHPTRGQANREAPNEQSSGLFGGLFSRLFK
eukprot:m.194930 g.194930  ORF g.194930 m.194930 type:complete len:244 (-) comp18670_c0_seq2:153-884(-)